MSFLGSLTIAAAAADLAVNIKNAAEKLLTNKPKEKVMPNQNYEFRETKESVIKRNREKVRITNSHTGWVCPVCGRGLAPSVLICSCVDDAATCKNPNTE